MANARLKIVKEIFSSRADLQYTDTNEHTNDVKLSASYVEHLKRDIESMSDYLKQVNVAISKLESRMKDKKIKSDSILKREILSLVEANSRLPVIERKGDTIGTSSASCLIRESMKTHIHMEAQLKEEFLEYSTLNSEQGILSRDLDDLDKLFKAELLKKKKMAHLIERKIATLTNNVSHDSEKVSKIKDITAEAQKSYDSMDNYLLRVIEIYVDSSYAKITAPSKAQLIQKYKKLLNDLISSVSASTLSNVDSPWLEILADEDEQRLITFLNINDIVTTRDDSGPGRYFIKLRSFGSDLK